MKKLIVKDFSCIKSADIDFSRLTIFIGPQASGKSVLCKLTYFAIEAATSQVDALTKRYSYEKFCEDVKRRFVEWFPTGAWGSGKFKIEFTAGNYSIALMRNARKEAMSDTFRIKLSPAFKAQYELLLKRANQLHSSKTTHELAERLDLEWGWKTFELSRDSLGKLMQSDQVAWQMFVPAGRSFFTSIGKAIAAFEQGRVLDPLIVRFGRMYTSYKNERVYYGDGAAEAAARDALQKRLNDIFGGELKKDGDTEYVLTTDGRSIPLSALSSGQQELLPLFVVLPHFGGRLASMAYIEEPEAHLFPSAQSKLVETLVAVVTRPGSKSGADLVVTTHSPYILAKINNLIKAGMLSRMTHVAKKKLEAILPRQAWLSGRVVNAYAIQNGVVRSIVDGDGLIDAEYLDGVSSDISREFSELLELEAGHE